MRAIVDLQSTPSSENIDNKNEYFLSTKSAH